MRDSAKNRAYFRHFHPITTRWSDNDAYGHVNNVIYYHWFDTVVNQFLIVNGTLDIHAGEAIALVVETHCNYFSSVAFPDPVTAGLCVTRLEEAEVRVRPTGHLAALCAVAHQLQDGRAGRLEPEGSAAAVRMGSCGRDGGV